MDVVNAPEIVVAVVAAKELALVAYMQLEQLILVLAVLVVTVVAKLESVIVMDVMSVENASIITNPRCKDFFFMS